MSNSASQGLYSPLPQSISDTDSEEELHTSIPRKLNDKKMMNGADKDYHHLDDNEEHINGFPNVNHNLDDVPIIKDGYKKPMSSLRKIFFVISITICVLTIVIFLWALPCSDDATCAVSLPKHRASSWEKSYQDIELMGPINIVSGLPDHSKNLVFLYRGDVMNTNVKQNGPKIPLGGGGTISIMGDTGKVAWYTPRQRKPTDIDCGLIDVDNNGEKDCLITGEKGLFETINPLTGASHWNIHIHPKNNSLFTSIDFPIILPDINNDNINDLLTTCSLQGGNHNILIVISGRMGNVLGKAYTVAECETVHSLEINDNKLTYICQNGNERIKSRMTMHDLFWVIFNKTFPQQISTKIEQHSKWDSKSNTTYNYYVNGRKLVVSNQGICPGNCNVSVQLIDSKDGKDNIAWSYTGTNMYATVPTKLNFKNTENNLNLLQGHVNGYIIKFWQWNDSKNSKSYTPNYIVSKKNKRSIFDDFVQVNIPWYLHNNRNKRSLALDKTKNITEQLLSERVMLITYNSTSYTTVNASQSDIRQLCLNGDRNVCQPDLSAQENSVLIADLDQDGSQELISYLTSYLNTEESTDGNQKYQLQSTIKVVRLEKELPKLYESVTKY